ncbi:hypothetical protein [Streptomyces hypolithicus]
MSRRELELHLTSKGRAHLRELRARREDVLLTTIEAMSATQRNALSEGLRGFQAAAAEAEPVPRSTKPGDTAQSA